ncbi:MAG: type II toxin-antitoxin system VapC family toxin [Geminicoccaceae bacterium]
MTGLLLDTNVVSEIVKPVPSLQVEAWYAAHSLADLHLTAVVVAEINAGIETMPMGRRRDVLERWRDELVMVTFRDRILPFDLAAADLFGRLTALAKRAGCPAKFADTQIAAVASVHGLTVATRDVADFAGFGVPLVNPWQAA